MSIDTVKVAGLCLLASVREKLRRTLFAGNPNACDIEADETAHPISGDTYVAIMPGGYSRGEAHATCGGVNDLVYDIAILVVKRITAVPKDRTRDAFLFHTESLEGITGDIKQQINWKYDVTNAANDMITEKTGATGVDFFHHPLVWEGESTPVAVGEEIFNGGNKETRAGLKRVIRFGMARFTDYLRA